MEDYGQDYGQCFRIYSDIHLDHEFGIHGLKHTTDDFLNNWELFWQPPKSEYDIQDILILAGDLAHSQMPFICMPDGSPNPWLANLSQRFKYVVIVFGNHDYYGCDIETAIPYAKAMIEELKNVFILDNEVLLIDNLKILGTTLWTNLKHNGIVDQSPARIMNDYGYISHDASPNLRLRPEYIQSLHEEAIQFLKDNAYKDHENQKVIVITHHSPTNASRFHTTYRNLYVTPIEDILSDVDIVVFGHTHESCNTVIDGVRYLSNARGYVSGTRINDLFDDYSILPF